MFQFELYPPIGEIRTDILVYEKGGVIKHIKAPARVKVEFPDLNITITKGKLSLQNVLFHIITDFSNHKGI